MNFQIAPDISDVNTPLVVHVPHSSSCVPANYRDQFVLDDEALQKELLAMTDMYTDQLFVPATRANNGVTFVNQLSRLVFDPERFEDDQVEPMAKKGMGAVYTSTSSDGPLRLPEFNTSAREQIIVELFQPYASGLATTVSTVLDRFQRCLLIDAHSFPSVPLAYEDADLKRPDLCIGFDPFHAPEVLVQALEREARIHGWSSARNQPFSGSYVPTCHYMTESRVTSVMLEVNRRLYMDENTGRKSAGFDSTANTVKALVSVAVLFEAFRHTHFIAYPPGERVLIRIGRQSEGLERVLHSLNAHTWAFITAFNPKGKETSPEANQHADRALVEELRAKGLRTFSGEGKADVGGWPAEPSHLIVGIGRDDAIELAQRFGQAALAIGERGEPAKLVLPD